MPRCIILTPLYAGEELPWIAPQPGDFLICADGGWACARQFGLTPQLGTLSQGILILLMFFGRVGGLTLIYAAFSGHDLTYARYPKEMITVG